MHVLAFATETGESATSKSISRHSPIGYNFLAYATPVVRIQHLVPSSDCGKYLVWLSGPLDQSTLALDLAKFAKANIDPARI